MVSCYGHGKLAFPVSFDSCATMLLQDLPKDIIQLISTFLLPNDLCALQSTSRHFYSLLNRHQQHLWKDLYKLHIDPKAKEHDFESIQDEDKNWFELFRLRWKKPHWDTKYKHKDIMLSFDYLQCFLADNCSGEDRSVRLNYGFHAIGTYYTEFQITRGTCHTLLGICDDLTAQFQNDQRPWIPSSTTGVAVCCASDGEFYGVAPEGATKPQTSAWETGHKIGIMVHIYQKEDKYIQKFDVQFYQNGEAVGKPMLFEDAHVKALYPVSCMYSKGEKVTLVKMDCDIDLFTAWELCKQDRVLRKSSEALRLAGIPEKLSPVGRMFFNLKGYLK